MRTGLPILLVWWGACRTGPEAPEVLQDPETCRECHPDHHRQWSGSMHAYASEDPVFRALNALGQAETDGELGDFCVQCHAPLALERGLTTDGLDLDAVPESLQGVGCAYCHQVTAVAGTHNNPLRLTMDHTMRGGIADPIPNRVHDSTFSPLHDRDAPESSELCGSCHDVVTSSGAHIERTYAEWQQSVFATPGADLSCSRCHMRGVDGFAAQVRRAAPRRVHEHAMPGVDVALTDFPEREDQRARVQEFLDDTLSASLCVLPSAGATTPVVVSLDNVASGHSFPSGATSDRRIWVEIEAFSGEERIWSSGSMPEGQSVEAFAAEPGHDDVWRVHSTLLDADGSPTPFFWNAAAIDESRLLRTHTTLDPSDPAYIETAQSRNFLVTGGVPDRIRMAVHVRPMPLDLLDELVDGGWLDPAVRDALPTFTLAPTRLEWTPDVAVNAGNLACVPAPR
ncbi:MAG: multiheme c-type cytochrome [Myxococcota bacterium]